MEIFTIFFNERMLSIGMIGIKVLFFEIYFWEESFNISKDKITVWKLPWKWLADAHSTEGIFG